jgi:hypothetical protein
VGHDQLGDFTCFSIDEQNKNHIGLGSTAIGGQARGSFKSFCVELMNEFRNGLLLLCRKLVDGCNLIIHPIGRQMLATKHEREQKPFQE